MVSFHIYMDAMLPFGNQRIKGKFIQQAQVQKQYKLINLTRMKTAENWQLVRKLNRHLIHLNHSLFSWSKESLLLTYDSNFILTLLQLRGIISILKAELTRIQFDRQIFMCMSTNSVTPNSYKPSRSQSYL